MSLKILVDMNLSPLWVELLREDGFTAEHWFSIGDPRAADQIIMQWARERGYVVLTHDLDFGTTLALTSAKGPSVVQVRTQDVMPDRIGRIVVTALKQHETALSEGALLVVDEARSRVRILPL